MYSVIMPTPNVLRANWCAKYLNEHSSQLDEMIIIVDTDNLQRDDVRLEYVTYINKPKDLDVYGAYNYGVSCAKSEHVLFVNDDMYFPKAWDTNLPVSQGFTTFDVVESGWIAVHQRNIEMKFGMNPEDFNKRDFDTFAASASHELEPGLGWYMPLLISKELFASLGGYNTIPPFPASNDVSFFNKAKENNIPFNKFKSFIYHFQCMSRR